MSSSTAGLIAALSAALADQQGVTKATEEGARKIREGQQNALLGRFKLQTNLEAVRQAQADELAARREKLTGQQEGAAATAAQQQADINAAARPSTVPVDIGGALTGLETSAAGATERLDARGGRLLPGGEAGPGLQPGDPETITSTTEIVQQEPAGLLRTPPPTTTRRTTTQQVPPSETEFNRVRSRRIQLENRATVLGIVRDAKNAGAPPETAAAIGQAAFEGRLGEAMRLQGTYEPDSKKVTEATIRAQDAVAARAFAGAEKDRALARKTRVEIRGLEQQQAQQGYFTMMGLPPNPEFANIPTNQLLNQFRDLFDEKGNIDPTAGALRVPIQQELFRRKHRHFLVKEGGWIRGEDGSESVSQNEINELFAILGDRRPLPPGAAEAGITMGSQKAKAIDRLKEIGINYSTETGIPSIDPDSLNGETLGLAINGAAFHQRSEEALGVPIHDYGRAVEPGPIAEAGEVAGPPAPPGRRQPGTLTDAAIADQIVQLQQARSSATPEQQKAIDTRIKALEAERAGRPSEPEKFVEKVRELRVRGREREAARIRALTGQ
jgi:hypothetical protein